jgi:uncharacterized protein (TIGR03382 family)
VVGLGNGEVHAVALDRRRAALDLRRRRRPADARVVAVGRADDRRRRGLRRGPGPARRRSSSPPAPSCGTSDRAPGYPWLGTLAAIAVADDTALVAFNRDDGLTGWNATTGAPRWANTGGAAVAINATPIVDDGVLYMVNARGDASAAELATGRVLVDHAAPPPGGFDWGYSVTAAPALADGRLFVPTQWDELVALDATTGAELWRYATPGGPLNFAHYRSAQAGFIGSPVVTGDLVWIGRPDGAVVALAADDGRERFRLDLGAPIVSGLAAAGDYLIAAGYDGTVHALVPGTPAPPVTGGTCGQPDPDEAEAGCCSTGERDGPVSAAAALVVAAWLGRRRRRA